MTGMTIYVSHKTYFYPTNQSRRTDSLAGKVAQAILRHQGKPCTFPAPGTVALVKNNMQFATLTYHALPNGTNWLRIDTGYSSHNAPADDPDTIILPVVQEVAK